MQSRRERSLVPKATTIVLLVMVAAIVGVLVATILLVVAPHPARAYHDRCPSSADPIQEGNTASMGVKRPGHRVVYRSVGAVPHTRGRRAYRRWSSGPAKVRGLTSTTWDVASRTSPVLHVV